MLYANVFTALESLLSDLVINDVRNKDLVLNNLGVNYDGFKSEKYSLKDLISSNKSAVDLAVGKLHGVVFHNLNTAEKIYEAAYGIEFPETASLLSALENRHDIVHRNGCKVGHKDAKVYRQDEVMQLIHVVQQFVINLLRVIGESGPGA
jgi:hypothetical protein